MHVSKGRRHINFFSLNVNWTFKGGGKVNPFLDLSAGHFLTKVLSSCVDVEIGTSYIITQ